MTPIDKQTGSGLVRVRAIAGYALVCLAIGGVMTALVIAALGGGDRDKPASLPPVQQTQLVKAARAGGCELRRAREGEVLRPPVDGPSGVAARPRFYDVAPPIERLTAALRRGVIVISYRGRVEPERLQLLRALQRVAPRGTIVTPDTSGMPYEVAVAAHRRLLGCERFSAAVIDAIRLFRGRYVGTGPDT